MGITYSNDPASTPSATCSFDRRGRKVTAAQGGLSYNEASQLTADGYSGSVRDGLALENAYDNCLRRTSCVLKKNGTAQNTVNYGYDAASQLAEATHGDYSAD